MYLDGRGLRHRGARGEVIVDDSFLLLLHSGDGDGVFRLPGAAVGARATGGRGHHAPGGAPATAATSSRPARSCR